MVATVTIATTYFLLPFVYNSLYVKIMEKAMAPHSSALAWKIPWMEEPGRLQSMGSLRVGHDWATSLSLFTFMHRRRKWQPTPVFLPGESQGRGSLVGCRLWGRTESDTTEATVSHLLASHIMHFISVSVRSKLHKSRCFAHWMSRTNTSSLRNIW